MALDRVVGDEDRTRREVEDRHCHTAQREARKAGTRVRVHPDERGGELVGEVRERAGRIATADDGRVGRILATELGDQRRDKCVLVPMCKAWAIHSSVIVVSCRRLRAMRILCGSPFRRANSSAGVQPSFLRSASILRQAFSSPDSRIS